MLALKIFNKEKFDTNISDFQIPGKDVSHALVRLKEIHGEFLLLGSLARVEKRSH
jgi:hypothetical protein